MSKMAEGLKLDFGKAMLEKGISMVLVRDRLFEKWHLLPFCEFAPNGKIVTYFPTAFDENHKTCWKYWKFNKQGVRNE